MRLLSFLFILLFIVASSHSQTNSTGDMHDSEITVSAEATVSAQPDIAEFHLGIISRQPLATDAFRNYLSTYDALKNSLATLVDANTLTTDNLSITPNFNYKKPDQIAPDYYQVTSVMSLSVPLSQLNKILGTITAVEGVTINGIEFRAMNQDSLQSLALEEAVKKAHRKASTIAKLENLSDLKVKAMTTFVFLARLCHFTDLRLNRWLWCRLSTLQM